MTDLKISQLPAAGALTGSELTVLVQGGSNVQSTTQADASLAVSQTITNGVTNKAPSEDAVFDALALKQPLDAQLTSVSALAYAGNAGKVIAVNGAEDNFELVAPSSANTAFLNNLEAIIIPVPATSAINFISLVNTTGNAIVDRLFVGAIHGGFNGDESDIVPNSVYLVDYVSFQATLTGAYDNGALGVGATITTGSTTLDINGDTKTVSDGDTVVLTTQTDPAHNGLYVISGAGVNVVLTRDTSFDQTADILVGKYFYNSDGVVINNSAGPITVGTTAINLVFFSTYQGNNGVGGEMIAIAMPGFNVGTNTFFNASNIFEGDTSNPPYLLENASDLVIFVVSDSMTPDMNAASIDARISYSSF